MSSFLRNHLSSTTASVALHVAIGAALTMNVNFSRTLRTPPTTTPIQAAIVDEAAVQRELDRMEARAREAIERREREEREAREAAEAAERERLREEQRLAELQRQREEAERREAERAEQARLEREREEVERLARERAAAEEERRRQEQERLRREEEERLAAERAAEEERQRLAAEAEARKQAELEAQLLEALAAEEESRRARDAGLLDEYIRNIENRIQQNWNRPPSAAVGLECIVNVTQIPSGDVTSVSIGLCNGDAAVVRSIEAAVLQASPLPRPPVPSLFNRNLEITFRPDN